MDIIPAIDLRGGYCVRLLRGDFSQEDIDEVSKSHPWIKESDDTKEKSSLFKTQR